MVLIRNTQRLIRIKRQRLRRDSERLLKAFNLEGVEVGVLLVNDGRMRKLNHRYRGIDKITDVLSFPTYDTPKEIPPGHEVLIGDIVINLHAAARQAPVFGNTFSDEVRRLLVHGFLHLLGYDHEKSPYHERKMRLKEKGLLDALEKMD